MDGFAAVDGFFDPPSCKEVALFSFFSEGVDGSLAADDFFDPPPGEEGAFFPFLADVVDCFAAAAFGASVCFWALPLSSRLFRPVCGSDVLSSCEDAEVGGGGPE